MISRRRFASAMATTAMSAALPRSAMALTPAIPAQGWRRFAVTTRIDLGDPSGPARAWIPLSAFDQPDWIRSEGNVWTASANARIERVPSAGAAMLHVAWDCEGARFAEVTSTVLTRDRAADLTTARSDVVLSDTDRAFHLSGSALARTDGIVKEFADRITAGKAGDVGKAHALYEWVVENTFRSAPIKGCGDGDIVRMLRSGTLGGKCADLNPLLVALARASGIPGRDLYGIRLAPSRLGYKSLGPSTATITKAQHCRAELFLDGFGWTAMDPADVRKVMLEETPGGLPLDDAKVVAARARLFGSWEGNWMPFNAADGVRLAGDDAPTLGFLMYPQVETAAGRLDCYDPDQVRYTIKSRELPI